MIIVSGPHWIKIQFDNYRTHRSLLLKGALTPSDSTLFILLFERFPRVIDCDLVQDRWQTVIVLRQMRVICR